MSSRRHILTAAAVVAAAVFAALFANELVLDLQQGPNEGSTLNCADPSAFWARFERCRGMENHLFWVAGLTAAVAALAAGLAVHSRGGAHDAEVPGRPTSALRWILVAALAGFAAVVVWGLVFEIGSLPGNV